jgi:dolichol-phosphate mannosyltransferase
MVPTLNEADNIRPLLRGIFQDVPDADVVFIDDASQDGTRDVVRAEAAARPGRIHLIERPGKLGLGTAYVAAMQWGLGRYYQAFFEMDADLSHRSVDLAKLVQEIETSPVVIGSRYVPGGATENWGLGRKIISRAGSIYARAILRMDIRDFTGGFNGWRREVLEAIDPAKVQSDGYTFQIELKYRAHLAGFPLKEVPILFVERRAGQSKMSGGIVWEAMYRVWHLALQRGRVLSECSSRPSGR